MYLALVFSNNSILVSKLKQWLQEYAKTSITSILSLSDATPSAKGSVL
jgi:hypothetical protein